MSLDLPSSVPLLNGELLVYSCQISYWDTYTGMHLGVAYITDFRIIFVSKAYVDNIQNKNKNESDLFGLHIFPILSIDKITKGSAKTGLITTHFVEVNFKHFQAIKFLNEVDDDTIKKFSAELFKMAFPQSMGYTLPAYNYKEDFKTNGWDIYDPVSEFSRMGIPNDLWRVTHVNEKYELCETYPPILAVPNSVTDELLHVVKEFRSRERLATLSWVHPNNQCAITRCSQPLTGVMKRNKEDEQYIQAIAEASPSCHQLVIVDARPKLNAVANQALGGGYEDAKKYGNAVFSFYDIANIHSMRESYNKLREVCKNHFNSGKWLSHLQETKWLEHVSRILSGAVKITENVDRNRTSVVIHCSDGWDRTSQLSSLAMLCLDPFYRTIIGFETLIEKEWCSFGHKFEQRYGVGTSSSSEDQRSPVFHQFIDCVWQILDQYPCAFQFTENMLHMILDSFNSGYFGTFLCDCQKYREESCIKSKTISIWSYINSKPSSIFNPLYCPERFQDVILPVPTIPYVKLWKSYYFKHNPLIKPKMDPERTYKILTEKKAMVTMRLEKLKAEIHERNIRIKHVEKLS